MRRRLLVSKNNSGGTNGYDYVDMGEAGIWATCNIGANSPEEAGLYFAWGETTGYADASGNKKFSWDYYKFGTQNNLTKYNSTDRLTTLELEDDAAHVIMGGDWRMPTANEFQELYNACDTLWTTQNGVNGRLFTLKNDSSKQLFFPAAGYALGGSISYVGSGYYWSSSLYTSGSSDAYSLGFVSSAIIPQGNLGRSYGLSVRGVLDK